VLCSCANLRIFLANAGSGCPSFSPPQGAASVQPLLRSPDGRALTLRACSTDPQDPTCRPVRLHGCEERGGAVEGRECRGPYTTSADVCVAGMPVLVPMQSICFRPVGEVLGWIAAPGSTVQ
jgi:hypothetical protein